MNDYLNTISISYPHGGTARISLLLERQYIAAFREGAFQLILHNTITCELFSHGSLICANYRISAEAGQALEQALSEGKYPYLRRVWGHKQRNHDG